MSRNEVFAGYPADTVYVVHNGVYVNILPFDAYAGNGYTYGECRGRLPECPNITERQDADLYAFALSVWRERDALSQVGELKERLDEIRFAVEKALEVFGE